MLIFKLKLYFLYKKIKKKDEIFYYNFCVPLLFFNINLIFFLFYIVCLNSF